MAASHTLLITGASSGLGLSLALLSLKKGHKVIAAGRSSVPPSALAPNANPGLTWLQLDPASLITEDTVSRVVKEHAVDVIVNNAGYSALGAVEDVSEEEVRRQFEVNVFGPVRIIRAALPWLRERGGGVVVNVSSVAGVDALPGSGLYAGSKFALEGTSSFPLSVLFKSRPCELQKHVPPPDAREGISEALSRELAPFNIRVLIVEPGAFRTNFLSGSAPAYPVVENPAYKDTPADAVLKKLRAADGKQAGDPDKAAERMLEAITGEGLGGELVAGGEEGEAGGLRLLLGTDSLGRMENKLKSLVADYGKAKRIAVTTDL